MYKIFTWIKQGKDYESIFWVLRSYWNERSFSNYDKERGELRDRYWGQPAPHWASWIDTGFHCTCLIPVKRISLAEIKIKNSKLLCPGQTLWLASRRKASSFREVVKEETVFSRKQSWPILRSYGCFLSGRPQLAVRARDTDSTPRGPLRKNLCSLLWDQDWSCVV